MRLPFRFLAACLLSFAPFAALAQEGYYSSAVVPVAVDSTSFTQSFVFNSFNGAIVKVKFYPGAGTPQATAGPVTCKDVEIRQWDATRVASLRQLCPALLPGGAFGFLVLRAAPSVDDTYKDMPLFAMTSRIANPAGAGFVVDGVATASFTTGQTSVGGIRRSAATDSQPAYQTNCFLANLDETNAGAGGAPKRVDLRIVEPTDAMLSVRAPYVYTGTVYVAPGQLLRLLDVFASTDAPPSAEAWDWTIEFMPRGSAGGRPGIATFCTVQENTSYQADLRLGKIFFGIYGHGAEELQMARSQYWNEDVLHRPFAIPPGDFSNTHLVYFRRPDTVKCELISATYPTDPNDLPARLTPADGLEIRMLDATGAVVGGGSGMTSTGQIYLGDKSNADASLDGRYLIEVESNGQNAAATRNYSLYCTSGSGNTGGLDLTRYQEAVDRF